MIDYIKLQQLLYQFPDASDKEIAKKYSEIDKDILNEIDLDTLRRKINFLREIPPDYTHIPKAVFDSAFERYLLEKKLIKKKEILKDFNISDSILQTALDNMRKLGLNIKEDETTIQLLPITTTIEKIRLENYDYKTYRFGAIADIHLGSLFERLDLLYTMYDIFEKEGINVVFMAGNWIDGESKVNMNELKVRGIDGQIHYFVENFPYKKNMKTYFLSGDDHEGWWQRSVGFRNLGYYAQLLREQKGLYDLEYIGYLERDIEIFHKDIDNKTIIRVVHNGGGSAYAISYKPQKIIESYINDKPNILLLGHYHKHDTGWYRNVWWAQLGCFQDQTTFMRKNSIQAVLGGCIIELSLAPDGAVNSVKCQFYPFFDKKYYVIKDFYLPPNGRKCEL